MIYQHMIQFSKTLKNLSAILEKGAKHAENKKFKFEVLLNSRLAPDQFNFIRQVQLVCDTAKFAAGALAGKESTIPAHPDTETTLPELHSRIESVLTYLGTFAASDFAGAAERHIARPRWEGRYLTGEEFLLQHAVPNFYFHVTTAYAIFRHNGVDVGKKDYLGELPLKS
jgi:hypothetical protein